MKLEVDRIFSPVKITFETQQELDDLCWLCNFYIIHTKAEDKRMIAFANTLSNSIKERVK